MIALLDHPADIRERSKARGLAPTKGIALEMRNYAIQQVLNGPRLVLESAVALRLTDPTAFEECL